MKTVLPVLLLAMTASTQAAICERVQYKPNKIIEIQSALTMGTRLQLPANLISKPFTSNNQLWDVEGAIGTNQIVIKPNSDNDNGKQTMIFAYTDDGIAYDITAIRTTPKNNQPCVVVNAGGQMFTPEASAQLAGFVARSYQQAGGLDAQVATLRKQLITANRNNDVAKQRAVRDALRKYRYHIYTRYDWNDGKAFVGNNTVADVYDDGRFTYIRLANPNRGVLSVETQIGGKNAIAPSKYDDAYGMYRITGIYPAFTLRVDDVEVTISRRDNATQGAS